MNATITSLTAREVLGGSGRPTVEVSMTLDNGVSTTASVPSGTSRGSHEAFELFDRETRHKGYGVRTAAANVRDCIAPALIGASVMDQGAFDARLLELDGTEDKSNLGANAILPVSVAAAKAAAATAGLPVYRYLGGQIANRLPMPIATVIAGGEYSPSALPFEDFLYIVKDFPTFAEALDALAETRRELETILTRRYGTISDVGGALAPPLASVEEAFDVMLEACRAAGYEGRMDLALDVAANEIYDAETQRYTLGDRKVGAEELCGIYCTLAESYPLRFIEDGFHEEDFASHARLKAELEARRIPCSVVGDDLFVTNPKRLLHGIECRAASEMLFKINQIGTLTEAMLAAAIAHENGLAITLSLRSNDTSDPFVADMAVAIGAKRIKAGSPVRAERTAKYNRLLAIEDELGARARFSGAAMGL